MQSRILQSVFLACKTRNIILSSPLVASPILPRCPSRRPAVEPVFDCRRLPAIEKETLNSVSSVPQARSSIQSLECWAQRVVKLLRAAIRSNQSGF
jgi:hypothetical protein